MSTFVLVISALAFQLANAESCPAPRLCDQLGETRDHCEANVKGCTAFVDTVEKLLPKYDCTENGQAVPAIFLCDRFGPKMAHENAVRVLAKLKSKKARKVFGSQQLRDTLDGDLAEQYRKKSESADKLK